MQSWDGCQCARVSFRWVALKTERPQDRGPHRICGPWANTMSTSQRGSGRTHASLAPTTPVRRNTSWRSIPVTFTENLWSVINGTYYYYLFLLTCFLPLSHGFLRVAEFYSKVILKKSQVFFWECNVLRFTNRCITFNWHKIALKHQTVLYNHYTAGMLQWPIEQGPKPEVWKCNVVLLVV